VLCEKGPCRPVRRMTRPRTPRSLVESARRKGKAQCPAFCCGRPGPSYYTDRIQVRYGGESPVRDRDHERSRWRDSGTTKMLAGERGLYNARLSRSKSPITSRTRQRDGTHKGHHQIVIKYLWTNRAELCTIVRRTCTNLLLTGREPRTVHALVDGQTLASTLIVAWARHAIARIVSAANWASECAHQQQLNRNAQSDAGLSKVPVD
jgi:hypothetical protein